MKYLDLVQKAQLTPVSFEGDAGVSGIQLDSRKCSPGTLFVCMPGTTTDSHLFLEAARDAGATAAAVYSVEGFESARRLGLSVALFEDMVDAAWRLCDAFFDHPTRAMKVIGVTGTNGKTTTCWLIRDLLASMGVRAGYLGTLGFSMPGEMRELPNTTPFAVDLYNLLAEARDKGVEAIAMEVSSHALDQKRVEGVEFDAAVFTNLSQDHLDYHGTMEAYESAKRRFFIDFPRATEKHFCAAINIGDPVGKRWVDGMEVPIVRFERSYSHSHSEADVTIHAHEVAVDQIKLSVERKTPNRSEEFHATVGLGGDYNVENLVSAIAGLVAAGYDLQKIGAALPNVTAVPGRFEPVPNQKGVCVLVDYAHTPDGLEKLLDAVRPLTKKRVLTVFGCGGDRDRTKRPKMGNVASKRSDVTIITSDNPRTEDPWGIIEEVFAGVVPGRRRVAIVDRREAIRYAIQIAEPGDVVVIAGKGPDTYQIIGKERIPMDDRVTAREALQ